MSILKNSEDVNEAVYKRLVRPVLEYGSCIWDPQYVVLQEEIEKVQKKAVREYDEVDTVLSTSFDGNSYNHDVCIIKKSTSVLEGGAKTLQKLQKSISQKKRNENKCKEDYVTCLSKMRQELQTITDVINVKDGNSNACDGCLHQQNEILRLQAQVDRVNEMECTLESQRNEVIVGDGVNDDALCSRVKELELLVDRQKHEVTAEKSAKEAALDRLKRLERIMDEVREAKEDALRRLERQKWEMEAERKRKEETQNRLRETGFNQRRYTTPSVYNLSQLHYPTKLGEQFTALYDNEWSAAFKEINERKSEKETVQLLLDILMEAHKKCLSLSSIERALKSVEVEFIQGPGRVDENLRKKLVDVRKDNAEYTLAEVQKRKKLDILMTYGGWPSISVVISYVEACIKLCWFMSVQDPPLSLYNKLSKVFDSDIFSDYTDSGKYMDFVVWPALYLYDGGPILRKGVAQGTKTDTNHSKVTVLAAKVSNEINEIMPKPKTTFDGVGGTTQTGTNAVFDEVKDAKQIPNTTPLEHVKDTVQTAKIKAFDGGNNTTHMSMNINTSKNVTGATQSLNVISGASKKNTTWKESEMEISLNTNIKDLLCNKNTKGKFPKIDVKAFNIANGTLHKNKNLFTTAEDSKEAIQMGVVETDATVETNKIEHLNESSKTRSTNRTIKTSKSVDADLAQRQHWNEARVLVGTKITLKDQADRHDRDSTEIQDTSSWLNETKAAFETNDMLKEDKFRHQENVNGKDKPKQHTDHTFEKVKDSSNRIQLITKEPSDKAASYFGNDKKMAAGEARIETISEKFSKTNQDSKHSKKTAGNLF